MNRPAPTSSSDRQRHLRDHEPFAEADAAAPADDGADLVLQRRREVRLRRSQRRHETEQHAGHERQREVEREDAIVDRPADHVRRVAGRQEARAGTSSSTSRPRGRARRRPRRASRSRPAAGRRCARGSRRGRGAPRFLSAARSRGRSAGWRRSRRRSAARRATIPISTHSGCDSCCANRRSALRRRQDLDLALHELLARVGRRSR